MFVGLLYKRLALSYSSLHSPYVNPEVQTIDQKEHFLPHVQVSKFVPHSSHGCLELGIWPASPKESYFEIFHAFHRILKWMMYQKLHLGFTGTAPIFSCLFSFLSKWKIIHNIGSIQRYVQIVSLITWKEHRGFLSPLC